MGFRRRSGEAGQASAELVAIVPLLVLVVAAAAQLTAAGWALWSAANAARAGARAAHVGGDPERVARAALPGELREHARISGDEEVRVQVKAPGLVPGVPGLAISAASSLDPLAGDG
ncbi:MAG TPA: hypothetical protein VFY99_00520 [Solirubrobacterales bacterium]